MSTIFENIDIGMHNTKLTFIKAADRLIDLTQKLDRPWSIAELSLGSTDYKWLSDWAAGLSGGLVRSSLNNNDRLAIFREKNVSKASAMGLLLIAFASESARRDASEGKLWQNVRYDSLGKTRFTKEVDNVLFLANNHPQKIFKKAIRKAVKDFGLRNAFEDQVGEHVYYQTILLQFGITKDDAIRRLSSWLSGQPPQEAILKLLNGPQQSQTFLKFWNHLKRANSRRIDQSYLRDFLLASPWACKDWINDLIQSSIQKRIYNHVSNDRDKFNKTEKSLLSPPRLKWTLPDPPVFTTRLEDISDIELSEPEYELRIGAINRIGIVMDECGKYRPTDDCDYEIPCHMKEVSVELMNANDEIISSYILELIDTSVDFSIYKMPEGKPMDENEAFDSQCRYAMIVDNRFKVDPIIQYASIPNSRLTAYLIEKDQIPMVTIIKDGLPIWRPNIQSKPLEYKSDLLRKINPMIPINDHYELRVNHTEDIVIHKATILGEDYPPRKSARNNSRENRCRSTRFGPIKTEFGKLIYPENEDKAPGKIRIILLVEDSEGRQEQLRMTVDYDDHGASIHRGDHWDDHWEKIPSTGLPSLSIKEAETHFFHIVPNYREKIDISENSKRFIPLASWKIYEFDRILSGVKKRKSKIQGLHGYGSNLIVRCNSDYIADPIILADSVIDHGVIQGVSKSSENGDYHLSIQLDRPIEIEKEKHQVFWWDRSGKSFWLNPSHDTEDGESYRDDLWTVLLPEGIADYRAIGVSYHRKRLGSWWADDWAEGLNELETKDDIERIIPWLKLPMLSHQSINNVTIYIDSNFGIWIQEPSNSDSFSLDWKNQAWRNVVRILYSRFANNPISKEQADNLIKSITAEFKWSELARELSDIHPLIFPRIIKAYFDNGSHDRKHEAKALIDSILRDFDRYITEVISEEIDQKTLLEIDDGIIKQHARSCISNIFNPELTEDNNIYEFISMRPILLRRAFCRECFRELSKRIDP